ncbi:MAG: hypothetical protein WCF65_04655 [Parachlamydiaceae bacterium]
MTYEISVAIYKITVLCINNQQAKGTAMEGTRSNGQNEQQQRAMDDRCPLCYFISV